MKLTPDSSIPDGEFHGINAAGVLIVRTVYIPTYRRLVGTVDDESDVVEWRTSPAGMHRLVKTMAWVVGGAQTEGNA